MSGIHALPCPDCGNPPILTCDGGPFFARYFVRCCRFKKTALCDWNAMVARIRERAVADMQAAMDKLKDTGI